MLEQLNENAFRATVCAPTPLVAEASTRELAVDRIRTMIRQRLAGVEMIDVEVPGPQAMQDPWTVIAGSWHEHPDAAEVEQNLKEYREEVDRDPRRL
jgi:hypothetical protein